MKIAVLFAEGTEEIEALTPVDVLRRANVECDIVSIGEKQVKGSHGVVVVADKVLSEIDLSAYDGLVIPGGMKGSINISNNATVISVAKKFLEGQKLVAAICAAPAVVLASHGLTRGRKATCYPSADFIKALGVSYTANEVEVDGNLITACGIKAAMPFSIAICERLAVNPKF